MMEQETFARNAGGTANAQTAQLANLSTLADLVGVEISFIAPGTNTGPTTWTSVISAEPGTLNLNVNGVGTGVTLYVPATAVPSGGSGNAVPTLTPTQIVAFEIKY